MSAIWGTADYPVPPTVLKILTEQCGYTFVTPEDFKGNMTSAKLEFYGGETYTADKADLPALQKDADQRQSLRRRVPLVGLAPS